jgi:DNA-binding transcriptional LysR family regulator
MDVEDLRAFLAVADELHFGRAAQRLHIAQPPLSRAIQRLERKLGTQLFVRTTRSVRLTAAGHALYAPAAEVLDALRRAEAAARSSGNEAVGEVRIAFAGISTHQLVARVARTVRSLHPGIELELSSQNFAQPAMKKLQQAATDIALGRWDVIPADVEARVVVSDSLVVAIPDTHDLAGQPQVTIDQLSTDGFITLPPYEGSVLPDRLLRLARSAGFVPTIVQVAPDTQTALALVSAEVGCHLTLATVAHNAADPAVVFVPLVTSASDRDVDLRAAWRRDNDNPAVLAVLQQLFTLGHVESVLKPGDAIV